jgi:hypothetical protein
MVDRRRLKKPLWYTTTTTITTGTTGTTGTGTTSYTNTAVPNTPAASICCTGN